jgi:ankyrin repeat protein
MAKLCNVKLLLATKKVNVNSKGIHSQTLLSWAAENRHEGIIKLLLATEKASVDSKDKYGLTPLSRAAENGHEGIVKLLLATEKLASTRRTSTARRRCR